MAVNIAAFAATQLTLLDAELKAEIAETADLVAAQSPAALQKAGMALTNLVVSGARTGLGGKTVLKVGADVATASSTSESGEGKLPEHDIRTGNIVIVADQPARSAKKHEIKELEKKGAKGVVTKISKAAISVALDSEDRHEELGWSGRVWMVKLVDEVTHRRMKGTMEKLQKMTDAEHSCFMRVLFGRTPPSAVPPDLGSDPEYGQVEWVDASLDDSQKDAVRFALAAKEIALIHGPPGTGKTHTLIELILQLLRRNLRILVCGPSNMSVDNIIERLARHKVPMLRLGHPARLLPSVLAHSLHVLTKTSEAGAIVRDVGAEMDAKQAAVRKTRHAKEKRAVYADLRELRKEYRRREKKCVDDLVAASRVVLATLHGSGGLQLRGETFDVVVIDEASQALEAQCWIPLLGAKKAVCAGDHLQLPPTIKSLHLKRRAPKHDGAGQKACAASLEQTLFDRLLALHGPSVKRMLTTQYRMNEKIMRFPSDELYEGKLVAADAVKDRLLKDLPYRVEANDETSEPLVFIDTQGGAFPEKSEDASAKNRQSPRSESRSNTLEAALVRQHVRSLVGSGVKPEDIAVITPYNAQVRVLASLKEAFPAIELGSVDGFQGREKEAVIVSLVRSNVEGDVGFLGEKRRLNVAMTRPKRSLTVIGDSETVKRGSTFLKKWVEFLEETADLRYPDPTSLAEES